MPLPLRWMTRSMDQWQWLFAQWKSTPIQSGRSISAMEGS